MTQRAGCRLRSTYVCITALRVDLKMIYAIKSAKSAQCSAQLRSVVLSCTYVLRYYASVRAAVLPFAPVDGNIMQS
jgi:hypothetical protein